MKKSERTDRGAEKRRPWQPMKSERLTSVSLPFSLSLSISLSVVSLTRIQQTTHMLSFHNRLRRVWWPHAALSIIFDYKPQRLTTAEVWSVFKTARLTLTDSSYHSTHTHFWPTFSSSLSSDCSNWAYFLLKSFLASCHCNSCHILCSTESLSQLTRSHISCISTSHASKTIRDLLQPWWASVLYVGSLFILVSGIWGWRDPSLKCLKHTD